MARCPKCHSRIRFRDALRRSYGAGAFVHCKSCGASLEVREGFVLLVLWVAAGFAFGYWADANLNPTARVLTAIGWIIGALPIGYFDHVLFARARLRTP